MKYKYLIPKYIDGHFATIDFDNLFVVQFFEADPIELFFETKTQDYNYEKYQKTFIKKSLISLKKLTILSIYLRIIDFLKKVIMYIIDGEFMKNFVII